jgi:1-acyl-sn-glycerol-3-phosphate acyltransferase
VADVTGPAAARPPSRADRILYITVWTILVWIWARLWFRLQVVHRDRVPASGPYVIAPVHRSNLDFLLAASLRRGRMRYIAKDSLWKVGPLGWVIEALGGFPVKRGSADREALRTCMQVIENGEPLVMFPEGTRQSGAEVGPIFDGPAYVAARTGVPLLPVGIGGSEEAMPKGAKWIRPRKVVLVVGEPILPPKGDGTGRVPRRVVRELSARLREDVQSLYDDARRRAGVAGPGSSAPEVSAPEGAAAGRAADGPSATGRPAEPGPEPGRGAARATDPDTAGDTDPDPDPAR